MLNNGTNININDIINHINSKINNLNLIINSKTTLLDLNIMRNILVDIQNYTVLGISLIDKINNKINDKIKDEK